MVVLDRPVLQIAEETLVVAVLAIVAVMVTDFPFAYPAGLSLGGIALYPELVAPGLLGLAALLGAVADGLGVRSLVAGALAAVTLLLASVSLYALYGGTASGVFGGGLLTLSVGVPLALLVVCRWVAREASGRETSGRIGN